MFDQQSTRAFVLVLVLIFAGCGGCGGCGTPDISDLESEDCDNGEDDNEDGLVDCDEAVCQLDPACIFEPADPAAIAPPRGTGLGDFVESVRFLWEADDPIVRGVDLERVSFAQLAVVRAQVLDLEGNPLAGVPARIVGRPEFGYTYSRDDGMVDLLAHGEEISTLRVGGGTHLRIDRTVAPDIHTYGWAEEIRVTRVSSKATDVRIGKKAQVAVGEASADESGKRTARVYFPPGVEATAVLPGGRRARIEDATVRVTEFTVGDSGPAAMPAELPIVTGYTYALELSVDEADEVGADSVEFSEPVFLYVDNFLGFDVGTEAPSGFYSRAGRAWEASENGRILARTDDGIALTASGGTASRSELADLGITRKEQRQIEKQFEPGDTFWRIPVAHFTPYDINWPYTFPDGARRPDGYSPRARTSRPCVEWGSRIECQNQVLSRSVGAPGTAADLVYRSDRVAGSGRKFEMPLTYDDPIPELVKIVVTVDIAGKFYVNEYTDIEPNMTHVFEWDGLDGYGRLVEGQWPIRVRVGHFYEVQYTEAARFGEVGGAPVTEARQPQPIWRTFRDQFGSFDARRAYGLGGWSLDILHAYDPVRQILYLSDAPEVDTRGIGRVNRVIERFEEDDALPIELVGRPVLGIDVAAAPDDSLYIGLQVGRGAMFLRRTSTGELEHVAGRYEESTGLVNSSCGSCVATEALIREPTMAVDHEGTLYVHLDGCFHRVDGERLEEVGDCSRYNDNNTPFIFGFVVRNDGNIIMAGPGDIRELDPSTNETEVLVGCDGGDCDELRPTPAPGTDVSVRPHHIAMLPSGLVYFSDDHRIGEVDSDGRVRLIAAAATEGTVAALGSGRDGRLYANVLDQGGGFVRMLAGTAWVTVAGASAADLEPGAAWALNAELGEPVPASEVMVNTLGTLAADSAGRVYYGFLAANPQGDDITAAIREISSVFPPYVAGRTETLVPAPDGSAVYKFDAHGRHLESLDGVTFEPFQTFEYGDDGLVTTVTDGDGNVTELRRGDGVAEIVGPFGHTTTVSLDGDGYATRIEAPDGATAQLGLGYEGLLELYTPPDENEWAYGYDSVGRLIRADSATGAWKELRRSGSGLVTMVTDLGVEKSFATVDPVTREQTVVDAAGLEWKTREERGGVVVETTQPDGVTTRQVRRADPRFGLQTPYIAEREIVTPSGLATHTTIQRSATLADPSDATSVEELRTTSVTDDQSWVSAYDVAARTATLTSPAGRRYVTTYDAQGRVVSLKNGDFEPWTLERDERGRIVATHLGSETVTTTYGADGFPEAVTSGARTMRVDRDANGRPVRADDGAVEVAYSYDAIGDLVAFVFGQTYEFSQSFTPTGSLATFALPDDSTTRVEWATDDVPLAIDRPSSRRLMMQYDDARRPIGVSWDTGEAVIDYDPETGNVARVTTPTITTQMHYDGHLLVGHDQTVAGVAASTTHVLGDGFRVTRETVAGAALALTYDADGNATSVGPVDVEWRTDADALSRVVVDAIETTPTYDAFGEVIGVSHEGPAGLLFSQDYTVSHGVASRITQTVEGTQTVMDFTYDAGGRVVAVDLDGTPTHTYRYDTTGNRVELDGTPITYDSRAWHTSVGAATYEWDADGFLSATDDGTVRWEFQHDARGALVTATDGTVDIRYGYDGRGRRVARWVDDVLDSVWVYDDAERPAARLDGSGDLVDRYVYATSASVPDAIIRDGTTYRLIRDHRYSVRLVVDARTGDVAQLLDYDPVGRVVTDTNPGFQPFAFATGMLDDLTGLTRIGGRDYDPSSGRWLTPDPRGFVDPSTSLHQYVAGDPINFVDPAGEARTNVLLKPHAGFLPYDFWRTQRAASESANLRYYYLGGLRSGPANTMRHCTWQCDWTRLMGASLTQVAGAWHENSRIPRALGGGGAENKYRNGVVGVDRLVDEMANRCGRHLGRYGSQTQQCSQLCYEQVQTGGIPLPHQSHWRHWDRRSPSAIERGFRAFRANLPRWR